jgi:flagellar hook assembly protein FlgD/outer membrane protein OmpA-like peptidoglycan-associated protein
MKTRRSGLNSVLVLALLFAAASVWAYDPPAGGPFLPVLPSAAALSQGSTVTALDAPWADMLNPAASAGEQRPTLEADFIGIDDLGGGQGLGGGGGLGFSLPTPYAVWGADLRFLSTPSSMTDLPLGTLAQVHGSIAKDLFPNFYVGAGLGFTLGDNGGLGWGAGLDLGIMHLLGDVGFIREFRWGAVLTGIGKGYQPPLPATGVTGGSATAFPPPFTLGVGARGLVIKSGAVKLGLGADFFLPSFDDFAANFSGTLTFNDVFGLRMGWGFSAAELAAHVSRSVFPSIGLTATIPLNKVDESSLLGKQGIEQADLKPYLSAAPLYGSLWAFGAGAVLPLGSAAKIPPKIDARFPFTNWGPPAGSPDWRETPPGPAKPGATGAAYISPNNDGVQDDLVIPVTITDKRYILRWTFTVTDSSGAVVRTISNKVPLPESVGVKGLWEHLIYVKHGVVVPEAIVWNGIADSGKVVPDGNYTVTIEAVDDNSNRSSVGPFPVVVRDTPPKASAAFALTPPIFSPGGDSSKTSLLVKISGSVEDLWTVKILDVAGKTVRTVDFKDTAPSDFTWDGRGDDGKIVPDGVYSFVLSSVDRAGNKFESRLDSIVVDTQQPPIGLIIDLATFSPISQTKKVENLFPAVPVKQGVIAWRLSVLNKDKQDVWSREGKDGASIVDKLPFDGLDASGKVLPQGPYQGKLTVTYQNGYQPTVQSPVFVLDTTPPTGSVTVDRPAFNPVGDINQNTVHFLQKGDKDADWLGQIIGSAGTVVRSWKFSPRPDASVEWDGLDDAGKPLPDGVYTYHLSAVDAAGNTFSSNFVAVAIDTEKKAVRLIADQKAFSTLPSSPKNRLVLSTQVVSNDRVKSYKLDIYASDVPGMKADTVVRTWEATQGVPTSFTWNGMNDQQQKTPDGRYIAKLSVLYLNGDTADAQAGPVLLDSVAPAIKVSASPLLFSTNDDSSKREVHFTQSSVPGDDWKGSILAPDGSVVKTWTWKDKAADFSWGGTDQAGNIVHDGSYRYEVTSTDAAGNTGSGGVSGIVLDNRPVSIFVTASALSISPTGDPDKRDVTFTLIVTLREGIDSWHFTLLDKDGKERSAYSGQGNDVPSKIVWDGRDASGAIAQGSYTGVFTVDYLKGDHAEARTAPILVNTQGVKAQVKITPDLFSPDNTGVNDELNIALSVDDPSPIADWNFQIFEQAVVEGPTPAAPAAPTAAPAANGATPTPTGASASLTTPPGPGERVFKTWGGQGMPAASITWDGRSDQGELVQSATDYPFVFTVRDILGNRAMVKGAITVDVFVIRDGDKLKIKVPSIVFRANYADFVGLDQATIDRNNKVVARIAQILNKFSSYKIQIEGFANSAAAIEGLGQAAIDREQQQELIPLSLGRAELIKKMLIQQGVDPARLSTAGLGASEPVVPFSDAQNRWKNRRVEFILIKNQ